MAAKAMGILKAARERLLQNSSLCSYADSKSASDKVALDNFVYKVKDKPNPLPEIVEFRSKDNKLAVMTVLDARSPSNVEFRTTIETERDEVGMDWSLRAKLQHAWDNRTEDGKLAYPTSDGSGDKSNWLIVDKLRHNKWWKYTNGSYLLTLSQTTDDSFGSTIQGPIISLKSCAISDIFESCSNNNTAYPEDESTAKIQVLVGEINKLHIEAKRVAHVISQLYAKA